jgi:hypothetical protein
MHLLPYPDPDEEIEASRHERLNELRTVSRGSQPKRIELEEAIRNASVLMKAVDDHLAGNPVIVSNPELYRLAYRAFENLFELHRAMTEPQSKE